jgi:hypothetical protein
MRRNKHLFFHLQVGLPANEKTDALPWRTWRLGGLDWERKNNETSSPQISPQLKKDTEITGVFERPLIKWNAVSGATYPPLGTDSDIAPHETYLQPIWLP